MLPVAHIYIWTPESLKISMSLSHLENLQIKWRTLPSTIRLFLTIIWKHVFLSNEIMMCAVLCEPNKEKKKSSLVLNNENQWNGTKVTMTRLSNQSSV